MPKQLINSIGLLIVLAIVAVGTFFVAGPLVLQAFSIDGQTESVAAQNATTQTQVDALADQKANSEELDTALADLRTQIPDAASNTTMSSLVSEAAAATKMTVVSITPAEPVAFTGTPTSLVDSNAPATAETGDDGADTETALPSKIQVPVEIVVTGPDLKSLLAFLDRIRTGSRLIGDIQVQYTGQGAAGDATINAVAFATTAGK